MNVYYIDALIRPLFVNGDMYHNQTLLAIQAVMSADEIFVASLSDSPFSMEKENVPYIVLCERLNL